MFTNNRIQQQRPMSTVHTTVPKAIYIPTTRDVCTNSMGIKSRTLKPVEYKVYTLCQQIRQLNPYNHNNLHKAGQLLKAIREEIAAADASDTETQSVLMNLWNSIVEYVQNFFQKFVQGLTNLIATNGQSSGQEETEEVEEVPEQQPAVDPAATTTPALAPMQPPSAEQPAEPTKPLNPVENFFKTIFKNKNKK